MEGEKLDVTYNLAARVARRLTGPARAVAETIPLAELRADLGQRADPDAEPPVLARPPNLR
eukprot:10385016-Lingulodinium_polyedra.AAC.1